ncbi:hypothetical protein AU255_17285 [Methyloprofundus sedimenti]|uniref:HMA domain-containing protein n=1 Tax=Methyloprofundus sedimenti TaxID=1420851 RepID=A0A1V8M3G1_9GAMM|nr:hypothetical protein [Methyloprofundus sedimenti]OQK15933.1 hypothetical protein AU255_17285 [Methyloprofundus sedimenti]
MSIQKEIILRYKSSGHVRFQIPERLCSDEVASFVSDAIRDFEGVYRVNLFSNKRKLSIRFTEESVSLQELAKQLIELLTDLENKGFFNAKPDTVTSSRFTKNLKMPNWKGTRWAKEKYTETKETAQAISILAKLGLKKKPEILANPEKTLITFFNDVLVLFLIKIHWKLITKKWILEPLKYRYQWLTIFYLMFLFIRSKTTKSK